MVPAIKLPCVLLEECEVVVLSEELVVVFFKSAADGCAGGFWELEPPATPEATELVVLTLELLGFLMAVGGLGPMLDP